MQEILFRFLKTSIRSSPRGGGGHHTGYNVVTNLKGMQSWHGRHMPGHQKEHNANSGLKTPAKPTDHSRACLTLIEAPTRARNSQKRRGAKTQPDLHFIRTKGAKRLERVSIYNTDMH